ncbi:hypothetical protein DFH07DRAFT_960753 [Mycena maculata]|uniref:Uncharacterized protein n=1 Tax=Mycena maculata TaxID=230809 RepID=A0AAD7IYD2_9AGAR|nr:hypothetical protein DFH07DRAFT_960753 [Mycena maculata]
MHFMLSEVQAELGFQGAGDVELLVPGMSVRPYIQSCFQCSRAVLRLRRRGGMASSPPRPPNEAEVRLQPSAAGRRRLTTFPASAPAYPSASCGSTSYVLARSRVFSLSVHIPPTALVSISFAPPHPPGYRVARLIAPRDPTSAPRSLVPLRISRNIRDQSPAPRFRTLRASRSMPAVHSQLPFLALVHPSPPDSSAPLFRAGCPRHLHSPIVLIESLSLPLALPATTAMSINSPGIRCIYRDPKIPRACPISPRRAFRTLCALSHLGADEQGTRQDEPTRQQRPEDPDYALYMSTTMCDLCVGVAPFADRGILAVPRASYLQISILAMPPLPFLPPPPPASGATRLLDQTCICQRDVLVVPEI